MVEKKREKVSKDTKRGGERQPRVVNKTFVMYLFIPPPKETKQHTQARTVEYFIYGWWWKNSYAELPISYFTPLGVYDRGKED